MNDSRHILQLTSETVANSIFGPVLTVVVDCGVKHHVIVVRIMINPFTADLVEASHFAVLV